ncbi:MAG: neutral/alkaline non-lysosomal ceramidase N-terminal domain-containing protein [Dehalococcoidia bacterium]|nr:neutral/alkaline non-lysosomal ceramidase N-terminal domain-containing protein [Dehalococcoidia bacterium]
MRNVSLLATVVIMFVSFLGPVARGGEAGERPWSVGYAEADITPAPGQCMMEGFGSERYAKGALAPLLTQVVAFRDRDGHTGVLISADVGCLDRVMAEVIRRAIARKHGIPAKNVMLAASHTHWGPAVSLHPNFSCGAPNVWYMGSMEDKMLANVDTALENLSPATVEYGSIDLRTIGCCRRLPRDGEITWGPYPEGSFDGHTPILHIKRDQSPQQLVVVGHACHPTSSGKIEKWSPDYPGAMRDLLADKLPDTKGVFVQGCGGDTKVVHKDPETGKLVFSADPKRSQAAGQKLAKAVLAHIEKGPMVPLGGQLACSLATGQISYGECWSQEEIERQAYEAKKGYLTWTARQFLAVPDCTQSYRYDVQVWKLGNQLTIFGMEGEVCSPWGPMLRSMAHTQEAMVIGYANNTTAYIPDKRIVHEGGYEGLTSHRAYFLPGPFTKNIDSEIKQIVNRAIDAIK